MDDTPSESGRPATVSRRAFTKGLALGLGATALPTGPAAALDWTAFFQKHFREMSEEEIRRTVERLEREARHRWRKDIRISTTRAMPGVVFGAGVDLSRCIGCRRCVYACVEENNQSRNPQVHWITVLRFRKGEKWSDLANAEKYYEPGRVPEEGFFYLPVQCQLCDNSPCVPRGPSPTASSSSTTTGASAAGIAWPPVLSAPDASTGRSRRFPSTR